MKVSELRQLAQTVPESEAFNGRDGYIRYFTRLGIPPEQLYRELEMEDRYVEAHHKVTLPGKSISNFPRLHTHSFFELIYCENPAGSEYLVGAKRYKLCPGDVLLVSPGINHCSIQPQVLNEPFICSAIWISPDFMNEVISSFNEMDITEFTATPLFRTDQVTGSHLGVLFGQGIACSERRELGWKTALVGTTLIILSLLRRIARENAAQPPAIEQQSLVEQILTYTEQHLSDKLSLADMAKTFYVSESTISQVFRKKMGISFYQCVTNRRLAAAKSLIQSGIPLESVATQIGFSDYSTFFRAFKQEFGISPRQYRKTLVYQQDAVPSEF